MKRSEFKYTLPQELIAQYPLAQRSDSRLLSLAGDGRLADHVFRDLPGLLAVDDLLVFNDTRVIPARLFARKPGGGRVEILVERMLDQTTAIAQLRASKPTRPGSELLLDGGMSLIVEGREESFYRLRSPGMSLPGLLSSYGHMPLPPYIDRPDEAADQERYQTIYARRPGAVAAPTAGLHFDHALLQAIDARGVRRGYVTLHVGAGTFQPLRVDRIEDHRMHAEYIEVSAEVCAAVAQTRERGGRVVAVGTTSVRSLEAAAQDGVLRPFQGDSRIFIHPGYDFRIVDGMITNFHLPESTLLMLVSAFAGLDNVRQAYAHAIAQKYRFFSYGDAMFIHP